jgi:RNA polymerase sigma-70 factor (ECF subfamily)
MQRETGTRSSLLLRLRDLTDEGAWSQFVAIYTPLIFGCCRGRGLVEADAYDVTQDVLKAVAQALPRFEYNPQRSSFRNWLFTVVRSKLNNFFAAQARRPRPAGATTLRQFAETAFDAPDEEAWRREHQGHLVRWAAAQIRSDFSGKTWDAFWRTAMAGEDAQAVAEQLGLSLNALYIARSRVTSRLREVIDDLGDSVEITESCIHA